MSVYVRACMVCMCVSISVCSFQHFCPFVSLAPTHFLAQDAMAPTPFFFKSLRSCIVLGKPQPHRGMFGNHVPAHDGTHTSLNQGKDIHTKNSNAASWFKMLQP